jgi:hypothetical protein
MDPEGCAPLPEPYFVYVTFQKTDTPRFSRFKGVKNKDLNNYFFETCVELLLAGMRAF